MIIDTHTHFYDPTRPQGVPWPSPENALLYRRVMPEDFRKLPGAEEVTSTVVVEASPWIEDNQWILDLAERERCIVGFVGNIDPNDEGFPEHLSRFSPNRLFSGVRVHLTETQQEIEAMTGAVLERAFWGEL